MKKILVTSAMIMFALNVYSMPKKYTDCSSKVSIQHPANSNGVYFSNDCKVAYVNPPVKGSIEVVGFVQAVDSSTCRATMSDIGILNEERELLAERRRDAQNKRRHLERSENIEVLEASCKSKKEASESHDNVVQQFEGHLNGLKAELKSKQENIEVLCASEKSDSSKCRTAKRDSERLIEKISGLEVKLVKLKSLSDTYKNQWSTCDKNLEIAKEKVVNSNKELKALIEEIDKDSDALRTKVAELTEAESEKSGGEVTFNLLTNHENLVSEFRELNKNINVGFERMNFEKAILSFEWVTNGIEAGLPVTRKAQVAGVSAYSDAEAGNIRAQLLQGGEAVGGVLTGQAVQAKVVMSNYAACRLSEKLGDQSDNKKVAREFAKLVNTNLTYQYSLSVLRSIKIAYEESHLYQLIRKNSSKGGLFSSKTVNSLTERSEAEKWINIEITAEDTDHKFANAEQYLTEIRKEYVDAALMKVARSYMTGAQVEMTAPGSTGAEEGAKGLRKCPHIYCQYAAIALDIGSALFGSKTSEANMTKIVKAKETTKLQDNQPVIEFGSLVYSEE
jgi:hypothetical protein